MRKVVRVRFSQPHPVQAVISPGRPGNQSYCNASVQLVWFVAMKTKLKPDVECNARNGGFQCTQACGRRSIQGLLGVLSFRACEASEASH